MSRDASGHRISIHDVYRTFDTFRLRWQPGAGGYPVTISSRSTDDSRRNVLHFGRDGRGLRRHVGYGRIKPDHHSGESELCGRTGHYYVQIHIIHVPASEGLAANYKLTPVLSDCDSLRCLFPQATSAWRWQNAVGQYQSVNVLGGCEAYWINMPQTANVSRSGLRSTNVSGCLRLVGGSFGTINSTVAVSSIQQVPSEQHREHLRFSGAYSQATGPQYGSM